MSDIATPLLTGSLSTQHDPSVLGPWEDQDGGVRIIRAKIAVPAPFSPGGRAARIMLAAPGKLLVDFGLRRAHGAGAGLMAARASYIAGFAGTATVLAEKLYGIPTFGTMAHSFIQAYDDESQAFEDFARSRPENLTVLIDTYDTEAAARKVVALAPRLKADGIAIRSVRLDSGDLAALSKSVRRILDEGGQNDIRILASGGLDEDNIAALLHSGAPRSMASALARVSVTRWCR